MTTSDEGVREIQLNGKQLVFLFMAVTVVSVIIFLCGVLVGRGVQRRTTALVDAPVLTADDDLGAPVADGATPAGKGGTPDLSYPTTLGKADAPVETLKKTPPKMPPAPAASPATPPATPPAKAAPAATPAPVPPTPAPAAAAPPPAKTTAAPATATNVPTEPRGSGFAIQVAALKERGEAEVVLKRLLTKGYSAYLVSPARGTPPMFRVRVGKFSERAEAEKVASRLEREEQFKPWITR